MNALRISAVSYLNTYPFVYGIKESGFLRDYTLELDIPSVCAGKLKNGSVDVALIPVGALPEFVSYEFMTSYCIGAVSNVRTVLLLSHKPLNEIEEIGLDFDSRTSIRLVRVLADKYWNINPAFRQLSQGELSGDPGTDAVVAIGDKTFGLVKKYPYHYDLAEEWIKFTSLPFVFAAWVSVKKISPERHHELNEALAYGVGHISETLDYFAGKLPSGEDCKNYLEKNISFSFDKEKKKGMELFLSYFK